MMTVECAGCSRPILDRFLLHFLNKTWHSNCVKCQICRKLLDEKCFFKEGSIYCREDFYRCFGPKCSGCKEGILPQDYVRKARDKVYHLRCFSCSACAKELSTGEVLYLGPGDDNTQLLCKEDYLKSHQDSSLFSDDDEEQEDRVSIPGLDSSQAMHGPHGMAPHGNMMPNHHHHHHHPMPPGGGGPPNPDGPLVPPSMPPSRPTPNGKLETNNNNNEKEPGDMMKGDLDNDSLDGEENGKAEDSENKSPDCGDGAGGKRRGPRTTIKAKQLEVLKHAFSQTPKPTRHIREQLAKDTGLSMRVIQVWFQNKRSKERRLKQMTNGMVAAGRGFFPGKGGRRGFPLIGDEFGYFPHDKPYHDFGYPPNFPPPDGFFPGPMGFMGPNGPNGPNMDQPLPMGPMNGPPGGPSGMVGPGSMPPVSGSDGFPPTSMAGGSSDFGGPMGNPGGDITPSRPSPVGDDFTPNSSSGGSSSNDPGGFGGDQQQQQQQQGEQMVW